jgi:hypothetical protein
MAPRRSIAVSPMVRRHVPSRRFAKPIVMADGSSLASPAEAMNFLKRLPSEQVTAPLYYAAALVTDAVNSGRAADAEKARGELIRALRGAGWL